MDELIEKLSSFVDEQYVKPVDEPPAKNLEENTIRQDSERILEVIEDDSKTHQDNMQSVIKELYQESEADARSIDTPELK